MNPWEMYGAPIEQAAQNPWEMYAPEAKKLQSQGYVPEKPKLADYAKTILDQGLQGATFGFSDEVIDPLAVAGTALIKDPMGFLKGEVSDPALNEEFANARQNTQDRLQEQLREMPVTSIASNIGGGLVTGLAGSTTKAGAAAGNFLRSGNTTARAIKGAVTGAASGGLYGYGSGADGQREQSARRGAILGGAVGAAAPIIGNAIAGTGKAAQGLKARGADALDDTLAAIKEGSRKLYTESDNLGAVLSPSAAQGLSSSLNGLVKNRNTKAGQGLYKGTLSAIDNLNADLAAGNTGLTNLDMHRQILGNIAKDITNPNRAQEAQAASQAIQKIDDFVEQLNPSSLASGDIKAVDALNSARAQWSKAKKFEAIADVIKNSGGDANKLKNGLDRFLYNSKKTMGFSDAEMNALETAAKNTTGEGILKLMGKFGIDLGSARAAGNSGIGAALLSGITAAKGGAVSGGATLAAGTAARQAQKYIARAKAEDLLKVIEAGGNVPMKQIMALPPNEAKQLLTMLRTVQIPNASVAITQSQQ